MEALQKLKKHPAVDAIRTEIHKEHPVISKPTIYRNLRQLAENGQIRRIVMPDGLERYDVRADQHYHFRCKNCGSILDVDIGYIDQINDAVQKKYDVFVQEHDVVFTGVCSECKSVRERED